jgi:hypothetical protein
MNARTLAAADAFYAGALARTTSAQSLNFAHFGMSCAGNGGVLSRCYSGRVGLPVFETAGLSLTEHAQVQRDHADKKEYRNEVFLQSSPILKKQGSPNYAADFTKLPLKQHDLCQRCKKKTI